MASDERIAAGSPEAAPRAPDPVEESGRQFREEVLPEELEYLRDRRSSHRLAAALDPAAGVANDLTGVAFSGGGIRSATFNLGLLQALARNGLFRHVDYLSTVSGGGFIGSSLTALMSGEARGRSAAGEPEPGPVAFPFPHRGEADEAETVSYLRGHSDYLAPQGLTDYLRAFALLARGIALNLLLLLPILLIVSLVGMFVYTDDLLTAARLEGDPDAAAGGRRSTAAGSLPGRVPEELDRVVLEPDGPTEVANQVALTYGPVEGLRVWGLLGNDPLVWRRPTRLWTESSAVTAASLRGGLLQIAAAGDDGTLWLFYPEEHGLELDRESGRVIPGSAAADALERPLRRLVFCSDGLLVGRDSEGSVMNWAVGDRPEQGVVPCSPIGEAALQAGCPRTPLSDCPSPPAAGPDERPEVGSEAPRPAWLAVTQEAPRSGWNPHIFSLPRTGRSLVWLLAVFVGLYPFAALLAGPLHRSASVLSRARRGIASLWQRPGTGRGGPAATQTPATEAKRGGDLGRAATRRFAGSVLLAVPLFAAASAFFDPAETPAAEALQRFLWPFATVGLVALWWLLSVVFLVPLLRRWRSAPPAAAAAPGGGLRRALLLLAPFGVLLGLWALVDGIELAKSIFVPGDRLWHRIPTSLLALGWWLGGLALLRPVLAGQEAASESPEHRREWERALTGRLYGAVNLPLWAWLAHGSFHRLPNDYVTFLAPAVLGGWGQERKVLVGALALLGFATGLQFLLWKGFRTLALGRAGAGEGTRATGDRPPRPATAASRIVWRERYEKAFSLALLGLAAIAFFEIQPYLVYHYHDLTTRYSAEWLYWVVGGSFLAIVLAAMFLQALGGLGRKLVVACLGILGPLLPFLVCLSFVDALVYGERWFDLRWALFGPISPFSRGATFAFLVLTAAVGAYLLGKVVDANATGMHGFYRDRLSRGYLVGVDEDGVLGPEDELSLLDTCREGSGAPYHLINASLNMQRESAGAQRWRNSDFFVFSRLWCGGPHSGYCRTEHLEYLAPELHLGSAMAVSGAAAAPNMGSQTSRFVVMLMTLLNVRLGLWLPTPRRVALLWRLGMIGSAESVAGRLRRWWLRLLNRPSGYYLVKEMGSLLDASGPYVNLSDGGHLENTGAYELLRRRCRFIVIGDAESDPGMSFGSLAALMRYASIDLGIEIDIDPGALRPGPDGTSRGHFAVGTIRYPPLPGGGEPQTGRLLYVKTSVDGGESEVIREYRARHPDFPQESTADQVFEEDQFEAYRALGFHIGDGLFAGSEAGPIATSADIERWLIGLRGPPGRDHTGGA